MQTPNPFLLPISAKPPLGSSPKMSPQPTVPKERHRRGREGWLRAAVLGADDGIVSVASLMIGVAASSAPDRAVLVAGVAGLTAGALSMAAGEYVSVSSQRDSEQAEIAREKQELAEDPYAQSSCNPPPDRHGCNCCPWPLVGHPLRLAAIRPRDG